MNSVVGYCPQCGAPIYVPTMWHGITPPPNTYTCDCFPRTEFAWSGGTVTPKGKEE